MCRTHNSSCQQFSKVMDARPARVHLAVSTASNVAQLAQKHLRCRLPASSLPRVQIIRSKGVAQIALRHRASTMFPAGQIGASTVCGASGADHRALLQQPLGSTWSGQLPKSPCRISATTASASPIFSLARRQATMLVKSAASPSPPQQLRTCQSRQGGHRELQRSRAADDQLPMQVTTRRDHRPAEQQTSHLSRFHRDPSHPPATLVRALCLWLILEP